MDPDPAGDSNDDQDWPEQATRGADMENMQSAAPAEMSPMTMFAVDQYKLQTPRQWLYISHFLSTWNSRAFEFGAYLFLAEIYPDTLLPASVYALARAFSAALLSPLLGHYVDHGGRLTVIRISIVVQRVSVAVSCLLLLLMATDSEWRTRKTYAMTLLVALCLLAAMEKLGAVLNTIAVERDWVVVIAGEDQDCLRLMNSQMRRIDLFCKLVGPLAIAFLDAASPRVAITIMGIMSTSSTIVEYGAIARVYNDVPELQKSKTRDEICTADGSARRWKLSDWTADAFAGSWTYVRHPAFLPSFALALLYLTVLSFNGQMITYLLALGVGSWMLGILRGAAALFELSATWLAPKLMERIGPIRAGIWFINWQIFCVGIASLFFWLDGDPTTTVVGTVAAVIASRIGLWGFDLSAQIIVQEEVEADLRGSFSSQEFALQNVFEMLSFASTVVFAKPSQFRYPATISAGAVAVAGIVYAAFVRMRRGHLIHFSKCMDGNARKKRGWTQLAQGDDPGAIEMTSR